MDDTLTFSTLTLTLNNFITAFSGGYTRLSGPINGLLTILITIEVVLLGLWAALGGGDNVVHVFKKVLHIGVWVWIVKNFPDLAHAFVDSLIQAGLMAGGHADGDEGLIFDPGGLAKYGLEATAPLIAKVEDLAHQSWSMADMVVYEGAYLSIMVCFFIMAIHVFIAVLEYYLFVGCVGILLPFALVPSTKFLAEKAIGAVVACGIKLMVLSFVVAVIEPTIATAMHFQGPDITINELWSALLTLAAMTVLCWKAPQLASSVLAGSPSFGGGGIIAGAVGAVSSAVSASVSLASAGTARAAASALEATRAAAAGGGGPGGSAPGGTVASPFAPSGGGVAATAAGRSEAGAGHSAAAPPPGAAANLVRSSAGAPQAASPPTLASNP